MTDKNKKRLSILGFWLIMAPLIAILSACATQLPSKSTSDSVRVDSIVVEKVVKVVNPADSASLQALLECDENGKVVMSDLLTAESDKAKLSYRLDSLGGLRVRFKTIRDTIYLPSKTVVIEKTSNKSSSEVIAVKPSFWSRLKANLSLIIITAVLTLAVFFGLKFLRKFGL